MRCYAIAKASRQKSTTSSISVASNGSNPGSGATATVRFSGLMSICRVALGKCIPYNLVRVNPNCCKVYSYGVVAVCGPPKKHGCFISFPIFHRL